MTVPTAPNHTTAPQRTMSNNSMADKLFDKLDVNGDGVVDIAELSQLQPSQLRPISNSPIQWPRRLLTEEQQLSLLANQLESLASYWDVPLEAQQGYTNVESVTHKRLSEITDELEVLSAPYGFGKVDARNHVRPVAGEEVFTDVVRKNIARARNQLRMLNVRR